MKQFQLIKKKKLCVWCCYLHNMTCALNFLNSPYNIAFSESVSTRIYTVRFLTDISVNEGEIALFTRRTILISATVVSTIDYKITTMWPAQNLTSIY